MFPRYLCAALLLTLPVATAQTPSVPSFAVVAIKPNPDGHSGNIGFTRDGFTATNYALRNMIQNAYGLLSPQQLVALPAWANSAHYDIEAKFDEGDVAAVQAIFKQHGGYDRAQTMLQPILTDRFAMHFHWEQRTLRVYSLQLLHTSTHLRESNPADADKPMHIGEMTYYPGGIARTLDGKVIAHGIPMSFFTSMLVTDTHTIVKDDTHLTGLYDIDMQISVEPPEDPTAPISLQIESNLADELYQVGLKLVPVKEPVQVLVVDSIQQPSPN